MAEENYSFFLSFILLQLLWCDFHLKNSDSQTRPQDKDDTNYLCKKASRVVWDVDCHCRQDEANYKIYMVNRSGIVVALIICLKIVNFIESWEVVIRVEWMLEGISLSVLWFLRQVTGEIKQIIEN